jgi:flagellar motor switch protein FliM
MSIHAPITAAGRAARHCDELVARPVEREDGLGRFALLGDALAPLLAERLEPIFAAGAWEARVTACELVAAEVLAERIGQVAGNFLLPVGDAGGRLFASFALPPIGARLARMFGGEGSGAAFGARVPSSVVILLRRLERALTQALGECLDEAVMRSDDVARFETDLTKLGSFPPRTQAALLTLRLTAGDGAPIEVMVACRKSMLARLMVHFHASGAVAPLAVPQFIDPAMGAIPLPLRVQLAELKLSAHRLMMLRPGQVLPLSVARSVPLMACGQRLATGSIGEQDDRIALQIERVLLMGDAA